MTSTFIDLLEEAAEVLSAFTEKRPAGSRIWDGEQYSPSAGSEGDLHSAKWWGVLRTLADILEAQDVSLSLRQKKYLEHLLFGGMGSFNDFALDQDLVGPGAVRANKDLDRIRGDLFKALKELEPR